jgi:hypothetical protein
MKKKSCTRKILIPVLLLLSIAAGIWFVAANRFEDYVKNEVLPKLEKHEYWVKTDPNSIKIHKYKFSVSTGEITLFPDSEIFATKTDQMKFCYNPYKKQVTVHLTGKRVETGKGDLGLYYESNPNDFISFNQEIFWGDFSDMHIKAKDSKKEIKDILKNETISSAEETTYTITGSYNPAITNNYQLVLSSEGKGVQCHNADYFKRLRSYLYNKALHIKDPTPVGVTTLASLDRAFNFLESAFKEMEIVGPLDSNSTLSLELNKDHFHSVILALKGEKTLASWAGAFNILDEQYSLNINHTAKNSAIDNKYLLSLSNDGNKISGNIELSSATDLSDSQKKELIPLESKSIYESVLSQIRITNEDSNVEPAAKNFVVEDFEPIVAKILDLKTIDIKLSGAYDKAAQHIDHNFVVKVNSHEIDFTGKGKLKELVYDGDVKVSDPNKLINSVVNFTEVAVYPLVSKVTSQNHSTEEGNDFKQFINNVKDNGFKALGALNKDATLNPGDSLVTHLHFRLLNNFEFKINDKPFLNIMTDERVIPFLRGMPGNKNEQQQPGNEQPSEQPISDQSKDEPQQPLE